MSAININEFIVHLSSKITDLERKFDDFQRFKDDFVRKKELTQLKKPNYDLDPAKLAKHFGKSYENMRVLKKKYNAKKDDKALWAVYCRAYLFDGLRGGKNGKR